MGTGHLREFLMIITVLSMQLAENYLIKDSIIREKTL